MRKGYFSSALKIAQNANFAAWPSKTVTFWFYDQPSDLPSFYGPLNFAASMQQLSMDDKQYILTKLADLGTFTDITFTPGASAAASDLTFGGIRVGGGTYGWSSLGANDSNAGGLSSKSGDVWLNFDVLEGHPQYVPGNGRDDAIFKVIPHELGHALGLSHTHVGGDKSAPISGLTSEENTGRYSIMSYNRSVEENAVPYAYQLYDVAALQYLYGRNDDHEASNSLYSVFHQQVPSGDSERIGGDVATSVDRMFAIWDAGGVDTISNENYETSAVIDLRPGYFSSIGAYNNVDAINRTAIVDGLIFNAGPENISIAFGAYIENAKGGSNNDALIGNLLSNDLDGGDGDDLLFGEGRIRPDEQHSSFLGIETGNYDGEYDRVAQGGRDGPSGDVQPFVSDPSLQRDHLSGGGGNDQLWGGRGRDTLEGGTGENLLVGGPNYDTVSFGKDLSSGLALKVVAGSGETDARVHGNSNAFDRDAIVQAVVTRPGVSVDTLLEMEQVVLTDYSDKVTVTELGDPDGARPMSALSINFLSAGKGRTANSYYRIDDDQLDFSQAGRAITYTMAGIPLASGERGVRVDLRDASNQTVQYYTKWDPVIGFDYHTRSDVMLRAANANSVIGTKYDDVLIGESGKVGTNGGYSTLRGEDGNDMLVGAGWESHLFGGKGADHFEMGANSWIEDGTTDEGDSVSYLGVPLYGGVSQWWNEGHFAYWAGFSSLTAAFPVVGAELLYTSSFFVDAVTMKFVRYRLDADGTLEMNFGWGQAGQAAVKHYSLDLDSGRGTAGLTVFTVEQATAPKGTTGDRLKRFVNLALKAGFGTCLFGVDPLVLDLDGDGFELTTEQNSQVWFDYNHNGFAQHTGWVRGDDGFLVRDANANGSIDNISEMFGNPTAAGFDVLAGYDANADGVITAADSIFASLQVWQDHNQNGITDAGELKSLNELGIVSISLATTTPASPTVVGRNQVAHESSFALADGSSRKIGDVVFDVSTSNTRYTGDTTIDAVASTLPQLAGFGVVADLRVAMSQNAALKGWVSAFAANITADLASLKSGAQDILFNWAGVQHVAATPIGVMGFDARKLAFLEKYAGTALMPRDAQGGFLLDNLTEVEQLWADQLTRLTLRLVVQGPLASTFAEVVYRPDLDLLVATSPTSLADILRRVVSGLPNDHAAAVTQWAGWAPLLGALTESMVRADANTVRVDFLFQQMVRAVDDVAQPLTLSELASGLGIGNLHVGSVNGETLTHASGDTNIFYGGGGSDVLTGGSGQDVYVFGRQIGDVIINDVEPKPSGDRIRFAFLNAADVRVERDQNDLLITVKVTGETIRVTGQFAPVVPLGSDVLLSSNKGVEDIQFADGTIWEEPEIATAVGMGTDGNDHLVGTMHSDVLTGGKGDDLLEGGDDADLYVINAGDGHDTIRDVQTTPLLRAADMLVFGDGLAPEDLVLSRSGPTGDDLLFTVAGTGQTVLIQGEFAYTSLGYDAFFAPNSRVEAFAFRNYADGWSIHDLQQKLIAQSSTDGDDTILGFGDNDVIDGGKGNDTLVGLDGQDTYLWGKGDGNDAIDERALYIDINVGLGGLSLTAGADTVQFKDLNRSDLVFARPTSAPDLIITDTVTGEKLTVHNQFAGFQTGVLGAQWFDRVEWFQFADGSRISWQDVELIVTTGGSGADHLYGDILADRLAGGAGDDTLSGGGGADTYVFNAGDGHDTVDDHDESFLGNGFLTMDPNPDVLQFGAGINPDDISFGRNGPNVDLIIGSTGDRVTLVGQDSYIYTGVFGNLSSTRIEEIRFANGTTWTWHDLNQRMIAAATTSGNDLTIGTSTDDVFAASAGDDILDGGDGNDTYAFGRGSGHDIIRDHVDNVLDGEDDRLVFGAGLTLADLGFTAAGDDLIITILDTGDTVRIEGEFGYSAYFTWNDVETFAFADGSSITKADIRGRLLTGTSGNDTLRGFSSDDTYQGGAGDDLLIDRDGNDTYIFSRGDGHDTIQENVDYVLLGDDDTLRFGAGILPTDILLSRSGNDLTLTIAGTQDAVTIAGQFAMSAWFTWNDIEHFAFANGTTWSKDQVSKMLLAGTPGNDTMVGTGGNDLLDGGAGDDDLSGGDGSDTYVFGRGYGHDTIHESVSYVLLGDDDQVVFNADVAPSDLVYTRDGENLIVRIAGTDDVLTIAGEFSVQTPYTWTDVERFVFADGTILTKDDLRQKVLTGTSADEHIIGFGDNDVIDGAGGDDVLEGRDGSDTYRFGVGDGHDTIVESLDDGRAGEEDTLAFKAGVAVGDVKVTRDGQDAVFTLKSGDSVRVQGQFNQGYNEFLSSNDVEHVTFADSTHWGKSDIAQQALIGMETDGDDVLLGSWYGSTYEGKRGNDELHGDSGDDTYIYNAGDGDDVIYDDSGNDRIVFGAGIAAADIVITGDAANGDAMIIRFANRAGSIRVPSQWSGAASIDSLQFADGTTMSGAQIAAAFVRGQQTAGADVVWGSNGADVLAGGSGDDALNGKAGDDVYRFGRGDGHDTILDRGPLGVWGYADGGSDRIEFGAGITLGDIDVIETGPDDIALRIRDTGDSITILGQVSDGGRRIEQVVFADGTIWSADDLLRKALIGGAGDDTLYGSPGADVLDGGAGNDLLEGNNGNDTYRFGRGDGSDTILDRGDHYWWGYGDGGYDVVEMKAGVRPSDLDVIDTGPDDIVLKIRGTSDQLTLSGQVSDTARRIEEVRFADGTVWTIDDIRTRSLAPTDGDDVHYAGATAATLEGGAGNDTLYGSPQGDILDGGTGTDLLAGNNGNDTYRFGRGDGNDTILDRGDQYWWGFGDGGYDAIEMKAGVSPGDLDVTETGPDDIVVKIRGTSDQLTLTGQVRESAYRIEEIRFADGTVWSATDILARAIAPTAGDDVHYAGYVASTMEGGAGNDLLYATGGDDILDGGTGNDLLDGGYGGNDTYRFGRGDGSDTIVDRGPQYWWGFADGGADAVELKAGVGIADVLVVRSGDDLLLKIKGTDDRLTMTRALVDSAFRIEEVRFADGTVWTYDDLVSRANEPGLQVGGQGEDTLVGDSGADRLYGDANALLLGDGPNLLINGSFETSGDIAYSWGDGIANNTMPGWTKLNSQVWEQVYSGRVGISASDGGFWVDLDSGGGGGSNMDVTQTVSNLVAGQQLALTFDHIGRTGNASSDFQVLWNGQIVATYRDYGTTLRTDQLRLTAVAGDNVIEFRGTGAQDASGAALDNVRLQAIGSAISGGNDTLSGNAGDDLLVGGAVDDTLDGGAGADRLYGDLDRAYSISGPNLLVNGSFEQLGPDPHYYGWGVSSDAIPGWTKANAGHFNQVYSGIDGVPASDGTFVMDLDDAGGPGSNMDISQIVQGLTAGAKLLLAFDFGNANSVASGTFEVWWNDQLLATIAESGTQMRERQFEVTAAAGANVLRFRGLGAEDGTNSQIDNVRLFATTPIAGGGSDVLAGGPGDDLLVGGPGDDTYRFGRGDGQDTIVELAGEGSDTLVFSAGVAPGDVEVSGMGDADLVLAIRGTSDRVILKGYGLGNAVETIRFTDGGSWSVASLMATFHSHNQAPAIATGSNLSASIGELASATASTTYDTVTGAIQFTDANAGDVHTTAVTAVVASGATSGLPGDAIVLRWLGASGVVEPNGPTPGSAQWTFAAPDRAFDYLAAGQSIALTYSLKISDGAGGDVAQDVTIALTGSNDLPQIAAGGTTAANLTELAATSSSNAPDTVSGVINFTDADLIDAHAISVASVATNGTTAGLPSNAALLAMASVGSVTEPGVGAAGAANWTFSAADRTFDYLAAGETVTLTFALQITDGRGGTLQQPVAVTVTGTNDGPTIVAGTTATGTVTELSATTGSAASDAASGAIRFAELDLSDVHTATIASVSASGVTAGLPANATLLGWLSKGALIEQSGATAGSLPWSFAAPDSAFDYLRAGQAATLTYSVQLADGKGGTVVQNVAVTITGTNDGPTLATGSTYAASLAEMAATSGSTSSDTASGTIKFLDADAGEVHTARVANVTASGVIGGLPANATLLAMLGLGAVTDPSGATPGSVGWSFSAADKTFDYLAAGETVTLTFQVQVADGQGGTLVQPVAITVTGTNDAPVVAAGTTSAASVIELAGTTGSAANDTASGVIRFSDLDVADLHTATIASVVAGGSTAGLPANATLLGWLAKGALVEQNGSPAGSLPWSFTAPDSAFDYLRAGQTATLTYVIQLSDGKGGTLAQNVVVTITGSNDGPVIASGTTASGAINELAATSGSATLASVSGAIKFTDVDLGDIHSMSVASVSATGSTAGLPANATLLAMVGLGAVTEPSGATPGSLGWTFSAADKVFDYLAAGETVALTYQLQLSDGQGGSVVQPVVVTVTGTNDLASISAGTVASASLTELAGTSGSATTDTATGVIKFADLDLADVHTATVASVTASGAITGLPANATLLTWLGRGALVEQSGSTPGSLPWSFAAPDSAFDYLRAGQTTTLTYALQISDNKGGSTTQNIAITVTGTNDGPAIASGTTAAGAITELTGTAGSTAAATASGTIKFNDLDLGDVHAVSIASVVASGATAGLPANATLLAMASLGAVTEQAGATPGSVGWTFSAADKVFDYLATGETATLAYQLQLTDGQGGTIVQPLVVTVTGSNDAPTISAGTTASAAVTELASVTGSMTSDTASGVLRFADLDLSDVHSATIASVSASGVIAGLPANATLLGWLSKGALVEQSGATAGSLPWTFAAPDSAFDYLRAGQTATLTYALQVADGKGGSVAQNVVLTITGTNDGPTLAAGSSYAAALTEIAGASASTTADAASGTVKFTDADAGDVHAASVASVAASGVAAGLPANATLLAMLSLGALTDSTTSAAGSVGWAFSAADKTFDYLAAGETVTLTYQVQVTDGQGGVLAQPVTITVTGTNDTPVIAAGTTATAAVTELASTTGAATNDTATGAIRFTDLDASDVHSATIASVSATGITSGLPANATLLGWLAKGTITEASGSTAGTLPWSFAAPDSAFDYLGASQTATLTYVVQLADGKGGSVSQNVAITITGTNDAPLVVVPGAQVARTSIATRITGISIGDPDANAASETATLTTTVGTLAATATSGATVTGSATKSLTISGTIAQVNATLATLTYTAGASAGSDTISVATSDGTVTTTRSIAITASTTANHGPLIDGTTTSSGSVTELASTYNSVTNDTATGTIKFTDTDVPDTHTVTVSSVAASGITSGLPANATLLTYLTKGTVTEPSGTTPGAVTWTFSAPDKTFDYLGAGQVATLSYVVTVTDSKSSSVTQTVTITVAGTNDGAVLATGATTTAAITELASAYGSNTNDTASGAIKFTDEAGDTHSATITGVAASGIVTGLPANATMLAWLTKGALTEQSGSTPGSLPWDFAAPDSAFDYLSAGQTATLTYTVRITDNLGGVMDQSVTVTVTGTNDTPTATAKSGFTTDNWTALTITGATLLAGATDPDKGDTLTLSSVQGASGGTVALTSGNAVFTPTATTTGPASFTYTIADGKGGTSTATAGLTVTLHQTNGTANADTITGTTGKKAQINGLGGNDTITAGSAGDVIVGGAGDDTLTGAAGIDTFVYQAGFGKDVINSFTATGTSHDVIQVDKTLFADWAHLLGATKQVGADLVITYDASNTITLKNVALANFTSADAAFV